LEGWRFVVQAEDGEAGTYHVVNTEVPRCLVEKEVYSVVQRILTYFEEGNACLEDYDGDLRVIWIWQAAW
jgi:hypothetical protein